MTALERIDATIGDKTGTLVLRHVGGFANGAATADIEVLADFGSGDFAGVTGSGTMIAGQIVPNLPGSADHDGHAAELKPCQRPFSVFHLGLLSLHKPEHPHQEFQRRELGSIGKARVYRLSLRPPEILRDLSSVWDFSRGVGGPATRMEGNGLRS